MGKKGIYSMGDFKKLTESEISKYEKHLSNDYKKDAYRKIINSDTLKYNKSIDKDRNDTFERIYRGAMTLARRRYGFGRNAEIGMSLSEIASLFAKEYVFYKSSLLSNFEETEGKNVYEKFLNAEKKTYEERTDNFFTKYGDEKVYATNDLTLNDYLNQYKEGKISKEKLNYIIEDFKESNEEYLNTDYKANNYESSSSFINDYFDKND